MDWLEPLRRDTERIRQENIEIEKDIKRLREGNRALDKIHKNIMKLKEPINYFDEIVKEYNRLKEIESKYYELIYQVETVFPEETRHETALRYIKNAEDLSKCSPHSYSL
jgi:hypothetical protein